MADLLTYLKSNNEKFGKIKINGIFPNELVMTLKRSMLLWRADYANYVVYGFLPDDINHY